MEYKLWEILVFLAGLVIVGGYIVCLVFGIGFSKSTWNKPE